MVGHLGSPQRMPQPSFLPDGELFFQDQVEEVQVAHLRGIGSLQVGPSVSVRCGRPSLAAVARYPCGDQLAHALSFGSVAGTVVKGRVRVTWS